MMRRLGAAFGLLCVLAFGGIAQAQNLPMGVKIAGGYVALGYCQLTSLASSTLISTCSGGIPTCGKAVVPCTVFAEICSESVALRYRDDGTAPTASVGMPINASTCFQYAGPLAALRIIQQASSGIVDISFYR